MPRLKDNPNVTKIIIIDPKTGIETLFWGDKGDTMNLLAESEHYTVYNEYENVIMEIKGTNRKIQIGDFYGEPQMAVISDDEKYCIMCGTGIIIYYLREPFREYTYHTESEQWREWGRNETEIWIESIKCVNDGTVEVLTEDGKNIAISVYN